MAPLLKQISLLLVTESPKLREQFRKIIQDTNSAVIAGEAASSAEAVDLLGRVHPGVVLLDLDMLPRGDMSLLQTCMIHRPTPVIVLPRLSTDPLAHCFEALSQGAVDCICKDSIEKNQGGRSFVRELVERVLCASRLDVRPIERLAAGTDGELASQSKERKDDILFCEDCGARNIFQACQGEEKLPRYCAQCGDLLENHLIHQHKRTHYVTIIAAGAGSYANVLKIIPRVPAQMSGAVIIVISEKSEEVNALTEYLDTISPTQVFRMKNGMSIEGGNCYVAAAEECFCMKPRSANHIMGRVEEVPGYDPVDLLMQSITAVFKDKTAGLVLSGSQPVGEKGLKGITENNGISAVLYAANCLHRQMGENILRNCRVDKIVDEHDATLFISELHNAARDSVSTA